MAGEFLSPPDVPVERETPSEVVPILNEGVNPQTTLTPQEILMPDSELYWNLSDSELNNPAIILPGGEELHLRRGPTGVVKYYDFLRSLNNHFGEIVWTSQLYGKDSPQNNRNMRTHAYQLKKKIKTLPYTIRTVTGKHGKVGCLIEKTPDKKVLFPNGEVIEVENQKRREVLKSLVVGKRVSVLDRYDEQTPQNELRLADFIKELRYLLPSKEYSIVSGRISDENPFYYLDNAKGVVFLPNGETVEGLTQKEKLILRYLLSVDLPVYMDTLIQSLSHDDNYYQEKKNLKKHLSKMRKKLDGKGKIQLATAKRSRNPAYMLVLPEGSLPPRRTLRSVVKEDDGSIKRHLLIPKEEQQEMFRRMWDVRKILEDQKDHPERELLDEVNASLKAELKESEEIMFYLHENLVPWARKFLKNKGNIPDEDLDQEGYAGLLLAIREFDPDDESGASFSHYAKDPILAGMRHIINEQQTNKVRVPERTALRVRKVQRTQNELAQLYGRDVSFQEAMDHLGISKRVAETLTMALPYSGALTSLDIPVAEDGDTLGELLPDVPRYTKITPQAEERGKKVRSVLESLRGTGERDSSRLTVAELTAVRLKFNLTEEGDMSFSDVGTAMNRSGNAAFNLVKSALLKMKDSEDMQRILLESA